MLKNKAANALKYITLSAGLVLSAGAETMAIFDDSFTISNPQGSNILSARWGTWNGSQFIQGSSGNSGYVDRSGSVPELSILLNQVDNSAYTQGAQLAVAIFTNGSLDAQELNWSGATFGAVLTDASWMAPAFSNNASQVSFVLSGTTSAVKGSFNNNGGNQTIGLASVSAIPEPSTYAALFGAAALGMAACRRRRTAA